MLSFDDALARILALATPLPAEEVALDAADGRVLAEDLRAATPLPGFDYSSMDGYAVRASDLPGRLPVAGESKTGAVPGALAPGAAMRIFTGAEVPVGADAVVMQEDVVRDGDHATFAATARPGQNIRRRGDDLAEGAIAIARGTRLGPAHLALAAQVDRASLAVARRPVVAILGTGDELRVPGSSPRPGTIPESITPALRAMARRAGAEARLHPHVPDDRAATEAALDAALEEADVLVTIGGVSVGDHDLVKPALEAVGVGLEFWRVAVKPGKPLAVGRRGRAIVLGLPGNPASAMVTFALFGVPLLRALTGDVAPVTPRFRAPLARALRHAPGRTEFARGRLVRDPLGVVPLGNQASGASTSMAEADAFIVVPADAGDLAEGTVVDVLLTRELGV